MSDTPTNPDESAPVGASLDAPNDALPGADNISVTVPNTGEAEPQLSAHVLEASSPEKSEDVEQSNADSGVSVAAGDPAGNTAPVAPATAQTSSHIFGLTEVNIGDSDGHAALAARWLGRGDSGVYDQAAHDELIKRIVDVHLTGYANRDQAEADVRTKTHNLSGYAWAYVLPALKPGATGAGASVLRGLLRMAPGDFDTRVQEITDYVLAVDPEEDAKRAGAIASVSDWYTLMTFGEKDSNFDWNGEVIHPDGETF